MKLTDEQKWEGAKLSALNGIKLFRSAEACAQIKIFGVATSLMILSSEETTKAITLATNILNNDPLGEVEQIFQKHKYKHKHATFYLCLPSVADKIPNHLKIIEQDLQIPKEKKSKELIKKVRLEIIEAFNNGCEDLLAVNEWLKKANSMKKNGFYIDFKNGKWITPDEISEEDYNFFKSKSYRLIQIMEVLVADNNIESYKSTKLNLNSQKN